MNHYRHTIKLYKQRQKSESCPFCKPETLKNAIFENDYAYIVPNLTRYDAWELHDVSEHLLLIPKRHIEALGELTPKERSGLIDIIAEHESKGYNIYARGVGFIKRSVSHQHTHLIKVNNKKPRAALFIQKPYLLLKK